MTKKLIPILILLLLLSACTGSPAARETTPSTEAAVPTTPTESTETLRADDPTEPTEKPRPTYSTGELSEDGVTLQVHFIDVGQADCALIECNNAFALIDAGFADTGNQVVEYLAQQGVQRLNLVVGTHPHGDHIGGLPAVLKAYPADNIWFSAIPFVNSTVNDFLYAAKAQSKEVQQPQPGQTFQLGDATITVLGPVHTNYEDVNDISLVLMIQLGEIRFLFTGDMEQIAETDLLNSGADLRADVLKVGHHGSYSSTGYLFLRTVAPTFAVISCGRANEYGHPHSEPMSRLRDAEVIIFRTDKMYNIVAVTDGENITFTWDNTYAKPWTPES